MNKIRYEGVLIIILFAIDSWNILLIETYFFAELKNDI